VQFRRGYVQIHLQLHFLLLKVLDVALAGLMAEFTEFESVKRVHSTIFTNTTTTIRGQLN
jgi:hypothetical protein